MQEGKSLNVDPDAIFEIAIENGADDVLISDDAVEIYTERTDFAAMAQALTDAGFTASTAELTMKPNQLIQLSANEAQQLLSFVESLDELDDVTNVYHNLELTDELIAELA